jgi:biotin operon repressor
MPTKRMGKSTKPSPAPEKRPKPQSTQHLANPRPSPTTQTNTVDLLNKKGGWTFLTNHSHVLILLTKKPDMVLREVASAIGITERAVQRIIADLEEDGFLTRQKIGRQNHYHVARNLPLRHPIESHRLIGDLVDLILKRDSK